MVTMQDSGPPRIARREPKASENPAMNSTTLAMITGSGIE
jgi:hypothetical protein